MTSAEVTALKPPAGSPHGEIFGFPKGAVLIVLIEFWERFSFYGMMAILVLFLTDATADGGFGWTNGDALRLLGIYTGLMYGLPAVGGFLADRIWGNRRAIVWGLSFMALGHVLMASPAFIPWLIDSLQPVPVSQALMQMGVPLGSLTPGADVLAAIEAQAVALGHKDGQLLGGSYQLVSIGFFAALGCLVIGNALMKSTLAVIVGDMFEDSDARRDSAYAYFYLSISVGALIAGLAVGLVSQWFGWHFGFSLAGFGMLIGLSIYLSVHKAWLGDIGLAPRAKAAKDVEKTAVGDTSGQNSGRLAVLGFLAILLLIYEIGWFQLYGSWVVFLEENVNRTVLGFTVPIPWFFSLNAAVVIVLTPLIAAAWLRMDQEGRGWDILQKYAIALFAAALSHAILAFAAGQNSTWIIWPILANAALSVGEVIAWISTYGAVYRTAPPGFVAAAMGLWYMFTLGIGGYLAGEAGRLSDLLSFEVLFLGLAGLFAVTGAVALTMRPWMRQTATSNGFRL